MASLLKQPNIQTGVNAKANEDPSNQNSNSSRATNTGFSLVGCAFYRFIIVKPKL